MKSLSNSEKKFCKCIVAGMRKTEAYMTAYPDASRSTAYAKVSVIMRRERVIAEIVRLRDAAQGNRESALLTLIEKRQYLARVVRSRPALLVYESDLWQTISETRYSAIYRVPDKIAAIIQDNKLAGHGDDDPKMNDSLTQLLISLRK